MGWGITITTPAVNPAVTVDEAKKQIELEGVAHHDDHINRLIASCTDEFRRQTHRQIADQEEEFQRDGLPVANLPQKLPVTPVRAIINVSIIKEDEQLDDITGDVRIRIDRTHPFIAPINFWPQGIGLVIKYECGAATVAEHDTDAQETILRMVAHHFDERAGDEYPADIKAAFMRLGLGDELTQYDG